MSDGLTGNRFEQANSSQLREVRVPGRAGGRVFACCLLCEPTRLGKQAFAKKKPDHKRSLFIYVEIVSRCSGERANERGWKADAKYFKPLKFKPVFASAKLTARKCVCETVGMLTI